MPLFWFLVGMSTAVAILCVLLPWLRTIPRFDALPALPWQVPLVALAVVAVALLLYRSFGRPDLVQTATISPATAVAPVGNGKASAMTLGSMAMGSPASGSLGAGSTGAGSAAMGATNAGSMQSAVAALEARLAKGGGSAGDWDLLAKSYDFMGQPDAAAAARRHELPKHDAGTVAAPGGQPPAGSAENSSGTIQSSSVQSSAVTGQVSLANRLLAKVPADGTLFIVAKSVDSPGPPLAVYRGSVGAWPVKFTLDDSNSMLPGRNLSSAGRVTVEARISQSGQALPASGDLRGSSGVLDPAQRASLKIVIDEVVK